MRVLISAGSLAVCVILSGCVISDSGPIDRFHEDFHYKWPVEAKTRIDAESFNGDIEIEGWDRSDVEISGSKYGSTEAGRNAIRIDVHRTPNAVEIRAIRPETHTGSVGAKFSLHVPHDAEVSRVTTKNGDIEVREVGRAEDLKSSNGAIRIASVRGDISAQTSNGSINAESLDGAAVLKTSNGRIHADKINGPFEAETKNGDIRARFAAAPSAPVRVVTSNGSIDLTMEQSPLSDIRAETKNNTITLRLPSDASARVTADTSNSSVSCDFDLSGGENEKGHLRGNIGSGGHAVELSTSNAHIRIAKGAAK